METLEHTTSQAASPRGALIAARIPAPDWSAVATWLLAALLVVYLALENGGYDPIPRDQIGVVVWWALLLGVAVGALPVPGRTRASLAALGLLFGFAVWTALSLGWTESAERTANELARVATYLGVFVLGICLVTRRRDGARHLLHGVTFGLALVAALGVLSRLHMAWFPPNELGGVFPHLEIERRLAYPLNYSSAMGALAGMTLPLLLAATASARTIAVQALAAASLPLVGLALYLATSGTGVAVAIVAMLAFFALAPDRLPKLLTFAAGAGGAVILATEVAHHDAVARGLPTPVAEHQGTELIWLTLAVCVGVALLHAGLALAVRHCQRPGWLRISRKRALVATAVIAVAAIPITIAIGLPDDVSHRWDVFKSRTPTPGGPSSPSTAVDFKGNGRYQFWVSAVEANESAPWAGIGPGTFEFWWARNGSYAGFVRDAHSLYLENLAELGIVGFLLITGLVLSIIGIGAVRALRSDPKARLLITTATAGCTGFALAAGVDWFWEIAALPVAFMLLAAVAVAGFAPVQTIRRTRQRLAARGIAAVASLALIVAIWFPLQGASALLESRADAANGDMSGALEEARAAADNEAYAASPLVQEALILEQIGRLGAAASSAATATRKEGTNWRTWLVLSRLEAERGRVTASIRAYSRARDLNPKSKLFRDRD